MTSPDHWPSLWFAVGQHVTITTRDRQQITGRVAATAPEYVVLIAASGSAMISTGEIRARELHDI